MLLANFDTNGFDIKFVFDISGQRSDDELAIQMMYLLYQLLMCHPIPGDYKIQNTGKILVKHMSNTFGFD